MSTVKKIALAIGLWVLFLAVVFVLGEYVLFCVILNGPTCRPESERFKLEPEILDEVRPYLASWAELPPSETEQERLEVGRKLGVWIDVWEYTTDEGQTVKVVHIDIEQWYDWTRGMIYVDPDVAPEERELFWFRKVEDHIYVFNSTY